MGRVEMLRDQVTTLYNEPESRPAALKSVIEKVGIEKVRGRQSRQTGGRITLAESLL